MSAEVGGQLEAVPVRRSLFGPDYLRILILLAVGVAVHGWLIVHTAVPARDSLTFARTALDISYPSAAAEPGEKRQRMDVIRESVHPPGFPLAVWVVDKALRRFTDIPTPDRALLATQLTNAAGAILLVVPLYLIGRILFGRNAGFAAALLFQVLPVPARVTSDGLSEGVYLLLAGVAIVLGVRAARRPGIGGFLLCGIATGATYLVRPEGLMVAVAVGAIIIAAGYTRRWPRDVALGRLTALAVGLALVAVPYMVLIGKLTNKTTAKELDPFQKGQPSGPIWLGQPQPGANAGGGDTALFAAWWNPEKDAGKNRTLWAAGAVWGEMIKALHYAVGVLAILGLVLRRRQLFAPDPGMWVLLALAALNLLVLFYLAARIGYVSERHTVLCVMIGCIFAASALEPLAEAVASSRHLGRLVIWPAGLPALFLAVLVAAAMPYTIKPMHPQREGHKHAGRWLNEHMGPDDWLVDPLSWGEWYAERTLYATVRYHGDPAVEWVIVENEKSSSPHSRLPQWQEALEKKEHGMLAYHWPENVPWQEASVLVYRVERKPAGK